MATHDWKDITDRLTKYLRLKQTPVGVKYFETKDELMAVPKVRIPTRHNRVAGGTAELDGRLPG